MPLPITVVGPANQLIYGQLVKEHDFFLLNRLAVDATLWANGPGGGASALTNPTSYNVVGQPGVWSLLTDAVLNSDYFLHASGNQARAFSPRAVGRASVQWEARAKLVEDVATVRAMIGLERPDNFTQAFAALPATHVATFYYDSGVGANIHSYSSAGGPAEDNDTGVATPATWHNFRIVWTTSQVRFYIDGVLVATHTAVPNLPMAHSFVLRTLAAASRRMELEKLETLVLTNTIG